jgi:hypothetical protein
MRAARLLRSVLLAGAIGVVGLATLVPGDPAAAEHSVLCLLCGERGAADALLNLLLFVPLGAVLGSTRPGTYRRNLTIAAVLSLLVELSQHLVPGRHVSAGDVLFNTLGAAAGIWIVANAPLWSSPARTAASRLAVLAGATAVIVFAGTGYLLSPTFPPSTYFGQWTPRLGHLEPYHGRVLDARIASIPLPPRRLADSDTVRALLRSGAPLWITATAGPPTTALGSLFSIYDDSQREILLVGPDGYDLVLRHRSRANGVRFDHPGVRLVGALGTTSPGDTVRIAVWRTEGGRCVELDRQSTCRLGFTVGSGWTVLHSDTRIPTAVLNAGWLALLMLPFGYWARRNTASLLAGAAIVGGLIVVPLATPLLATPFTEWIGAMTGATAGLCLQRGPR